MIFTLCATAGVAVSCVGGGLEQEPVGSTAQAASAERIAPVTQTYIYRKYLSDPEVASVSYAVGATTCPGVMIGPNTFITAAHCGGFATPNGNGTWTPIPQTIQFTAVRNLGAPDGMNYAVMDVENWSGQCHYLYHTFLDSDLQVLHCANNSAGIGPGDKFGYVDVDMVQSHLAVGRPVYSVYNEDGDLPATTAPPAAFTAPAIRAGMRVFGSGVITSLTGTCNGAMSGAPGSPNVAAYTDLWSQAGFSGSVHLDSQTHRILIGPNSNGPQNAQGRYSHTMQNYVRYGRVSASVPSIYADTINTSYINALGLVRHHSTTPVYASDFSNQWIDTDGDALIDVQEHIEWTRGENARNWYNLSFDSPRRNNLWTKGPYTWTQFDTADPSNYAARIINFTSTTQDAMAHTRLNLPAGTYRIAMRYRTNAVASGGSLSLGLRSASGATYDVGLVPTVVSGAFSYATVRVTSAAAGAALVLRMSNVVDIDVRELVIAREGATMDFDTFDKRAHWRNANLNRRAAIIPDGSVSGTPNWAGYVSYDASQPYGGYGLVNERLAMLPSVNYTVCFRHRSPSGVTGDGYAATTWGSVRFAPGASWAQSCFASSTTTGATQPLQFGFWGAGNQTPYLVDEVTVTPVP